MKKRVIVAGIASALILSGTSAFAVDTPPTLNCQTGEVVSTTYNATTQVTTYACVAAPAPLPTPAPTATPAPTPTPTTPAAPVIPTCTTGQRLSATYNGVTRITTYSCVAAPVLNQAPVQPNNSNNHSNTNNQSTHPQIQPQGQQSWQGQSQYRGQQPGMGVDDYMISNLLKMKYNARLGCFNNQTHQKDPRCIQGNFDNRFNYDGYSQLGLNNSRGNGYAQNSYARR
jgi:hypothetical protein